MATLLTMVNDLRVLLREEQVDSISATDELTQALIKIINRSAVDVLESRVWSFDKRFDKRLLFPPKVTGTGVTTIAGGTVRVTYDASAWAYVVLNRYSMRFRMTNDTDHPALSYKILTCDKVSFPGELLLTLEDDWAGGTGTADSTWEIFIYEQVLPSTVRKVLSVRDEEKPVQLYFYEHEIFGERSSPRMSDENGDPAGVCVGGTLTSTYNTHSMSTATVGTRFAVSSITDSLSTTLYCSYVYRHPQMSAATDTLEVVPDRIIRIIVDRAFYYCLSSNIEADPVRASHAAKQYRIDLELAAREDDVTPNRRRVMRPVLSSFGRHPNSRWSTREVPSP